MPGNNKDKDTKDIFEELAKVAKKAGEKIGKDNNTRAIESNVVVNKTVSPIKGTVEIKPISITKREIPTPTTPPTPPTPPSTKNSDNDTANALPTNPENNTSKTKGSRDYKADMKNVVNAAMFAIGTASPAIGIGMLVEKFKKQEDIKKMIPEGKTGKAAAVVGAAVITTSPPGVVAGAVAGVVLEKSRSAITERLNKPASMFKTATLRATGSLRDMVSKKGNSIKDLLPTSGGNKENKEEKSNTPTLGKK